MNKFYIQISFFLLTIFVYVNNKTLATEIAPKTKIEQKTKIPSIPKIVSIIVSITLSKTESNTESNTESKIESNTESKTESKAVPQTVPNTESKTVSKTVSKTESKTAPKTESNTESKKKTKPSKHYPTAEEIYENNKHLLCTDPEETKNAVEYMKEAVRDFKYHALDFEHFKYRPVKDDAHVILYEKRHEDHTDFQKIQSIYDNPNEFNKVINKLWDPDRAKYPNTNSVKRKIVRVYNPNLVLIQQRYKNSTFGHWKYFYALAAKVEISEDITIIVMSSPNINDHHPSKNEFKNTVIESANSFKIEVDSEEDIRQGKIKKTFVNIAGYYLHTYNSIIDCIFVSSVDGHSAISKSA
ncbi:fam-a protein [Plasmodium vinckei vinckei]|uniref:Fam-a protein n=1 Tax=Plasmodium vinckei vinckei TaxID=54757 RepID=A0A449BZ64_PLAVN|nr:fam-a protein [Plasmodium vinckei vinckei]VEV58755.1 fam-a protein [Plasmodium vinckei vinckei]